MSYKCRCCGASEVSFDGEICELCALDYDYPNSPSNENNNTRLKHKGRKILLNPGDPVTSGSNELGNYSDYPGQPTVPQPTVPQPTVPQPSTPFTPPQVNPPVTKHISLAAQPKTSGITKNVVTDVEEKSFISKWLRTLFTGAPYAPDNNVTAFQVFPDYTGTSLNSQGNSCDQVLVYGRINAGMICENNDVEVYGSRDSNNNIIATRIVNKASGTTVSPAKSLSCISAWIITLILLAVIAAVCMAIGPIGIIIVAALGIIISKLPVILKIIGVILLLSVLVILFL